MPPRAEPASRAATVDRLLVDGHALLERRQAQEAFARFQQAMALDATHAGAWHGIGRAYLALGQRAAGLALLRKAVAAQPGIAAWQADLGRALVAAGERAAAREHLQAAVDAAPADAAMRRDLAALCLHLDDVDAAEAHFRVAAELAPGRADLHEALARLAYRQGRTDDAVAAARRAIELRPALARTLVIGQVHPRAGSTGGAARAAAAQLRAPVGADSAGLDAAIAARDIHVFDDVLDDPLAYRAWALQRLEQQATREATWNFPGAQTPALPCEPLMQRIADAMGRTLRWHSIDHGALRLSRADDRARCDIHVDHDRDTGIYAGVLYLTLPEHVRGGTSFWRHRATGWERRPDAAALAAAGYASFVDFERRWIPVQHRLAFAEWQARRDTDWQWLFELPMRFNRLVVYRSDFFHSISELFGHSPDDARLVQLFYFQTD